MRNQKSERNGLSEKQNELIQTLQKGHKLINKQLFSSLYVIIMYLLFLSTFFLIGEQFESFDIFFISFNTFILVLVALNNIRILFPFWRELDSRFKLIGMKPAQEHLGIYEGITSYISQIHSMLYYPLKDSSVSITPRLYLSKGWIIQLIIGIIILIINHIIFVIFIDPQTFDTLFWLLISYIGVFLTYGAMVWHGLKARENFQQWIRTFEELRFWAESLESLPFIDVEET
ncbi:hypothetical protein [Candidatus Hodarchaeum mangrovi]